MGIRAALVAGFRSANEGWKVAAVSWALGLGMSVGQRILLPQAPASPEANPAALLAGGLGMIVLALGVGVLWTVWLGGALVWLKNRFDGAENSWTGFIEGGKRLFWALCWVMSLQVILGLGPPFILGIFDGLLSRLIGDVAAFLLVAVGMLIGLAVFTLLIFGACGLAERQQGAKVALKDSARFVRAHPGGTVGLLAALFLLSMAAMLALMIPLMLPVFLLKLPVSPQQGVPLLLEIPAQAAGAYLFFFALAAQYAYYRGNQPPAEISTEEAPL